MQLELLRILLYLAAANDWDICQLDIKTAYLYRILPEEEIQYMEQPKGFEELGKEDWIWELHKGTKEASDRFLADIGSTWEFKDLGEAEFCAGIAFKSDRENKKIGLSQMALIDKIANMFLKQPVQPTYSPMDPNSKLSHPVSTEKLSTADIKHLKSIP
ncbi:hypothetical protein NP233_g11549 [Leucocoprinus birnbaumii]|uniref:Reverse transcriptase Ty1/copia-type domain-containing protein n=1 Tax=Leucocoprinus birnbaumii TaxID=56174 RepID=A0AAD5YKB1_9AGAR|nr:hypothetical protein NP233_g11549 [Leucocoprinus birnbaumii]